MSGTSFGPAIGSAIGQIGQGVADGNMGTPVDGAPSTTGQDIGFPQIGMPAGPGYMQPGMSTGGKSSPGFMQGTIGMPAGPGFMDTGMSPGNMPGQIGMPAGPGFMQPTPLPTTKAQPQTTPLPSPKAPFANPIPNVTANPIGMPVNMPGQIGMPYGPGFQQPAMKPFMPRPAVPVPQTPQQIAAQVGIRQTLTQPGSAIRAQRRVYGPKAY